MKAVQFIPLFIAISALARPAFASSFIQNQFDAALQAPTSLDQPELEKVQSVQFIFVDGIFGDIFKSNFRSAVDVLSNDWNVTDKAIFTPDTSNPMSVNADILYGEISEVRASSPHSEAVLTAHSKGATEILLMTLRHPDVITRWGIKTINLISGPHEGTNVVQYFNHCSPLNFICGALNHLLPSIEGFTPDNIIPIEMTALANVDAATQKEIAKHLFYVETQMSDDDVASPLFAPHLYLNSIGSGPNDGLIPTANEVFTPYGQAFGNDLGIMKGDHNSLLSRAITKDNELYRKTFFQVLIKNTLLK